MKKIYCLLAMMVLCSFFWKTSAQVLPADSLALVDIYNAAGGPNWTSQSNWLTGPVSTWGGVTVTNNRVTALTLQGNNMVGTMSPSIGNLTELTQLMFNGLETPLTIVDLHGTLPAQLWNCTKLTRLQVKYTKISGPLPAGIEKLTALSEINFQQTPLKCEIPSELFNLPSLTKAYLHQSGFIGKVPSTLANATKLNRLYLQGNNLSAGLPFVALPAANAAKVELTGNQFTFADLKPYYDAKSNLASLICDNQYVRKVAKLVNAGDKLALTGDAADGEAYAWFKDSGTTPISLDPSTEVTINSAADNGVYTCKAQSSFAPGCNLLSVYDLRIPSIETDSLALVDIYNAAGGPNWTSQSNWITGPVSTWGGVTVTNNRVTSLTLQGNNMAGTMSSAVGRLTELTQLMFNGLESPLTIVDIHGSIPAELWNCTKLTRLQVKFTKMTGPLPNGIEKLTSLSEINFQLTPLKCEIPEALFNLPKLTKAYLHQSGFVGKVPASLANATKLNRLYLQGNSLSAGLPYVALPAANAAKVELTGNHFSFADLKPYYDNKPNLAALTCDYQYLKDTVNAAANLSSSYLMLASVPDAEMFAWFKGAETTPMSADFFLDLTMNTLSDQNVYTCKAQSSFAPGCNILTVYNLKQASLATDSLALVDIYKAAGGPNWSSQSGWLAGPLSTWGGVTLTNNRVTSLTMQGNNMAGTMSTSIGNLSELTQLMFNGLESPLTIVDLHGTIPSELWNCTKLTRLQVKYTKITGPLPEGVERLTALSEINFQQTPLNCPIPDAIFSLPSLTKAYLHQSGFTGKVPTTLTSATKLNRLYLHGNKLSAGLPFVNLSGLSAKVELAGNYFTFADLKPYFDIKANLAGLNSDYQYSKDTVRLTVGQGVKSTLNGEVTNGEAYAWFKDAGTVPVGIDPTLDITMNNASDGGIFTCKAQSSMASGCNVLTIYKLQLATGLKETKSVVTVYPNPVSERLYIQSDNAIQSIRLVDLTGKVLINQTLSGATTTEFSVGQVSKGVYLVVVRTGKGTDTHKIVKQ